MSNFEKKIRTKFVLYIYIFQKVVFPVTFSFIFLYTYIIMKNIICKKKEEIRNKKSNILPLSF